MKTSQSNDVRLADKNFNDVMKNIKEVSQWVI